MAEQINITQEYSAELAAKKKKLFEDIEADLFEVAEMDGIPHELHKDIALKLIAVGNGALVVENLSRFSELDQAIAVALVNAGFGLEVMNNMDYFDGLDDNIIAEAMLLSGQGGFVKLNQELFPSLTEETLEKINDRNYQPTPEDMERVFGQLPKIKKRVKLTDEEKEMLNVLGCRPEQIAHNQSEINENTRAYIGPLYQGIFNDLIGVEHIYTSFPEGKIFQKKITIGLKTTKELKKELKEKGCIVSEYADKMMANKKFKPLKIAHRLDLVVLSVADLGFSTSATRQEIYNQAQKLGLQIVPAEVGPHLRLQYEEQPKDERLIIGSNPLSSSGGAVDVFIVHNQDTSPWLDSNNGRSDVRWIYDDLWVFARPSAPEDKKTKGR